MTQPTTTVPATGTICEYTSSLSACGGDDGGPWRQVRVAYSSDEVIVLDLLNNSGPRKQDVVDLWRGEEELTFRPCSDESEQTQPVQQLSNDLCDLQDKHAGQLNTAEFIGALFVHCTAVANGGEEGEE